MVSGAPYGGESIDLVPGRLRGFRHWRVLPGVEGSPPRLASITAKAVWPWTPTVQAHCLRAEMQATFGPMAPHDPADVPNAECSCGIYAKHRLSSGSGVAGVIEAWGKIEVGDKGFRAQHARLIALANAQSRQLWPVDGGLAGYDDVVPEPLRLLGELYRVPVYAHPDEMVAAHPPGDVSELLGGSGSAGPVECAGCAANLHGDYALHSDACQASRKPYASGGAVYIAPSGTLQTGDPRWKFLGYVTGT